VNRDTLDADPSYRKVTHPSTGDETRRGRCEMEIICEMPPAETENVCRDPKLLANVAGETPVPPPPTAARIIAL